MERSSNEYAVFICSGKGKTRRESGSYTAFGKTYLDAVINFAKHWNKCSFFNRFGDNWIYSGRRKGLPRSHSYFKEADNELLLIRR